MKIHQLVEQGLAEACTSILPVLPPAEAPGESLGTAAVVGFTGDQLRGTLALAAGAAGLRSIQELLGADPAMAEDSFGETANLVAGHLKRALARYGQVLTITPPIVVRGVTIELCRSYDAARVLHDVHAAPEHIVAWVDYTADDDIELVENDDEIVQGGETLFF